ncbi:MAG: glycosyltransferase [Nitrososphaerota archaeon]|nr:glycosyltransferase [Nitrososphaerota archaeon]
MDEPRAFLRALLVEAEAARMDLKKLIVVASGCSAATLSELESAAELDPRVELFVEGVRHGKADAVNKILCAASGDYLVFVNSDAVPAPGAVPSLLRMALSDPLIGAVSALPDTRSGGGLASLLTEFMWSTHNECSLALNHMGIANHSSDELVVFRSAAIAPLPSGLVNDGAYMGGTAKKLGYKVMVCPSARVRVRTPSRPLDVLLQRRRILFGHAQVWREVGAPPRTIESMLFLSPLAGVRILVRALAKDPRYLEIAPMAAVSELVSAVMSIFDTMSSSRAHQIWRRFT